MQGKNKILIVDDEPMNIKLLTAQIPSGQYEVISASDGYIALEMVKQDHPELILLDIMMPGMDGYEVLKRLKGDSDTSEIPVILVTALNGTADKVKGLEVGADEFLNKPVNRAELLARINSLLRLKKYQDQLKQHYQSREFHAGGSIANDCQENPVDLPTVLLVEDDDRDAKLIQQYLFGQPYRLIRISRGHEAMSVAQQQKIDLILLDIMLPGIDGFEVCRRLKEAEETRNIQIAAITSLADLNSKVKGIEMGADDYLIKPINMYELRARVNSLIKKKAYLDKLHANYESAMHSAITDRLTGLYNHAYFDHFLKHEIKRSSRHSAPVALLMIDIDDFKSCNDLLGHLAGNEILKTLGRLVSSHVREIDLAARYGGEEFAVVLPHTDVGEAAEVAERIRKIIADHSFADASKLPLRKVSVSIGVAVYPGDAPNAEALIHKADQALYEAKRSGKNRVCLSKGRQGVPN